MDESKLNELIEEGQDILNRITSFGETISEYEMDGFIIHTTLLSSVFNFTMLLAEIAALGSGETDAGVKGYLKTAQANYNNH